MRQFLLSAALVLGMYVAGHAQGLGSSGNWPGWVQTWLYSGSSVVPRPLAVRVVQEVRDWGRQEFGLSLGQLMQRLNDGSLTVELVNVAPPMLWFRVAYGGNSIFIALEDI